MPRVVAVLAALVVEAHGFRTMVSAGCGLALRSSGNPHGLLPLGLRKQRAPVLRMQTQDTEKDTVQTPMEEAGAERGSFMGTKNFVSLFPARAACVERQRAHRIRVTAFISVIALLQ